MFWIIAIIAVLIVASAIGSAASKQNALKIAGDVFKSETTFRRQIAFIVSELGCAPLNREQMDELARRFYERHREIADMAVSVFGDKQMKNLQPMLETQSEIFEGDIMSAIGGEPLDRWKSLTKQQRDNIWNKFNREMGFERG